MRVFVAAELPDPVARALVAWCPVRDGLRPVRGTSLHLTLAFLGERSAAQATAAAEVVRRVAVPVGGLELGGARWLPARRPRVLAVDVVDAGGALAALQSAVVAGLEDAIDYVAERRRFLAHVTVARVSGRPGSLPRAGPGPCAGPFALEALTLLRSRLGDGPARYEALERVALSPFLR